MPLRPTRACLMRESAALSKLLQTGQVRFRFTTHARQEMLNDAIIEADVRHVVTKNGVCWVEWKIDELWHVEGADVDGRDIRVVIAVNLTEATVKVVTAMAL